MSDDPQDRAEALDEDVVGRSDRILSDEDRPAYPPDELRGEPFADADVTDESLADRARQEQPEAWERPIRRGDDDVDVPTDDEI
jgi:hypothetical protein